MASPPRQGSAGAFALTAFGLLWASGCTFVSSLDSLTDAGAGGGGTASTGASAPVGVTASSSSTASGGGPSCAANKGNCDGDPANGCEVALEADLDHCGSCGNACGFSANSFPICDDGKCTIGCNAGAGDCDSDIKNGCETATDANDANCGACGRNCQGGACSGGHCSPVVLAKDQSAPYRLAVNSTHVYWTEGAAVKRVQKVGGFVDTIYGGDPNQPFESTWAVVATESDVYWTASNPGTVYRAAPGGQNRVAFASGQDSAAGIAVDSTHVYWVRYTTAAGGGVYRKLITGGSVELVSSDVGGPSALAVDADSVVWVATQGGRVMKADKAAGATPVILKDGVEGPWSVAVHGDFVFVIEDDVEFGRVLRIPKTGGDAVVLADKQRFPFTVAADDSGVYWTSAFDGKVLRCDFDGANQRVVARELNTPEGLALDETTVYFGELLGNTIQKVTK